MSNFSLSKRAKHTGAMLAIIAPKDIVKKMRKANMVKDKEIYDILHMTLLYLGDSSKLNKATIESIKKATEKVCARHDPLEMRIAGAGLFTPGDDGIPVYVVPNAKGLSALQADLENVIGSIVDLPSEHGWAPHMTVSYSCDENPELPNLTEELEWTADKVRLQVGGKKVADISIGSKKSSYRFPLSKRAKLY
jgi:2'-5' RNA ligase